MSRLTKDPIRVGKVARLELLIEDYGVCGAMEMFVQALENIKDGISDVNSKEYLNFEHSIKTAEILMNAVDLDYKHGGQKTRTEKIDQLKNDICFVGTGIEPTNNEHLSVKSGAILMFISDFFFFLKERIGIIKSWEMAKVAKKHRAERNAGEVAE